MKLEINNNTLMAFDLDDTLYFEQDFVWSAFDLIAKTCNGDTQASILDKMKILFHQKLDVFQFLIDNNYISGLSKSDLIMKYREHEPNIELNPFVSDRFNSLRSKKIPMILITDGRSITQRNKIKSLGIEKYFNSIIISEEYGSEKSSGEVFKSITEQYPTYKKIMIGDNPRKDFYWPNLLGWKTIGLVHNERNIHGQSQLQREYLPQEYIHTFAELEFEYEQ